MCLVIINCILLKKDEKNLIANFIDSAIFTVKLDNKDNNIKSVKCVLEFICKNKKHSIERFIFLKNRVI